MTGSRPLVVAAWIGSANLGDELVFAGLRTALARAGVDRPVVALSVDPAATKRGQGVDAVDAHHPAAVIGAVRRSGGVVVGGGGLLQDETSLFNLPYHLIRPLGASAAGRPVAGVGLGAGPLRRVGAHAMVRRALARAVALTVRDSASVRTLAAAGLEATLGADLAWQLPPTAAAAAADHVAVCLRPWTGRPGRLPVAARRAASPAWFVDAVAGALRTVVATTGLGCHFVAVGGPADDALHREVAARLPAPSTFASPGWADLAGELSSATAAVSMRYHGGVAAALAGRPCVLVSYSPKVTALAVDLGPAAQLLRWSAMDSGALAQAVTAAVATARDTVTAARDRLRDRGEADVEALRRLDEAAP